VLPVRLEVTRHGKAHDPQPDPRDFAHGDPPAQLSLPGLTGQSSNHRLSLCAMRCLLDARLREHGN
jgi:hypothetical protein